MNSSLNLDLGVLSLGEGSIEVKLLGKYPKSALNKSGVNRKSGVKLLMAFLFGLSLGLGLCCGKLDFHDELETDVESV